jgi:2-polyprenyl-3-methyl-5-hydroxy-6-metoxy-1,4-benzoquinol methylase
VIDFGCADGIESIDMAQHGVGRIFGIDIRKSALEIARKRATDAGLEDRCNLPRRFMGRLIVSLDALEHFSDPFSNARSDARHDQR